MPSEPHFQRLLLATTSCDKIREIRRILSGLSIDLATLDDYPGLTPPEESGMSFDENARGKATFYTRATGCVTVADDSGLEIDALGGEPGVHSARYGGPRIASYAARFDLIYRALEAAGANGSPARFVCALAVVDAGRVVFEATGRVEGVVAPAPRGRDGFGYDPIFFYPPYGRTLAEVSEEEKSAVSHRGQAFRQLRRFLEASLNQSPR